MFWILFAALSVLVCLSLPFLVFVCVKLGTVAYFSGRKSFKRFEFERKKRNGNSS